MEVKAYLKGYRISPFKARLVANQIRGKNVEEALNLLQLSNKKAAEPISKLVLISLKQIHFLPRQ